MDSVLNRKISSYTNRYSSPAGSATALDFLTARTHKEVVEAIRKEPNENRQKQLKNSMPGATLSGIFEPTRLAEHLKKHSGLVAVDIDQQDNLHIVNFAALKDEMCKIPYVAYCGWSIRGKGFVVVIPLAYPEKHGLQFDQLKQDFADMGITIDSSGSDVCRFRYASYDPEPFINHCAIPYPDIYQPPLLQQARKAKMYNSKGGDVQAQVEQLINQLIKMNLDITAFNHPYNDWRDVGFALANQFGEAGRQYFHDVSGMHPAYNFQEADQQFDKCLHSKGSVKPVTIATFFHLCKQAGVTLEHSKRPATPAVKLLEQDFYKVYTHRIDTYKIQPAPIVAVEPLSLKSVQNCKAVASAAPNIEAEPLTKQSEQSDFIKKQLIATADEPQPVFTAQPEPLRRLPPENWTAEIQSLQIFFDSLTLPSHHVKLDVCTTITNVAAFTGSHLATVTANNGKPAFRPYLQRLQALKQHLLF